MTATGALLGLVAAAGLLLTLRYAPPLRRPSLGDRLAPYLGEAPAAASAAAAAGRAVERLLGGGRAVQQRLAALGSSRTVEEFRAEQAAWGLGAAAAVGLVVGGVAAARGQFAVLPVLAAAASGLAGGVLARDWRLTAHVRGRDTRMLAELPVVAELLALAVAAGEAPAAAIDRVCRLCRGPLAEELAGALAEARAGAPLPAALQGVADRTSLPALARFVDGVVIALERGTPLADLLRAQAGDAREAGRRELLATGGRREIAMLVPVVFLILPVTVLFALYPGLFSLSLLAAR
jgi:tight adherence protein C